MRHRVALYTGLAALSFLALPFAVHAASIPFFGPIIEGEKLQSCALGWGAVLIVINNIIRLLLTLLIVFVAPLMIGWAGFLLVVNPLNPHAKDEAKHMLQNFVIGFIVALAAWLIVDALMAVLYNGKFGAWYDIITTGGQAPCLDLAVDLHQAEIPQSGFNGGVSSSGIPLSPLAIENIHSGCNTEALTPTFGTYAAAMSCTTRYEDPGCIPGQPSGSDHTIANEPVSIGVFQINLTTNNLNYPQCEIAAGVSGQLNCTKAFSGQYVSKESQVSVTDPRLYTECVAAASDLSCNFIAAKQAFDDRINRTPPQNPLGAWGSAAQTNCSSLLPGTALAPFTNLIARAMVLFQHLTL